MLLNVVIKKANNELDLFDKFIYKHATDILVQLLF